MLSGTPTTAGTFSGVVDAANGVGSAATETFAIVIDQGPAFTSTSSATFVVGSASEFTVSDTGVPGPTLSESGGLPSGLTFNTAAGILSGTPASGAGGTYNLVFTVSNGAGACATQNFTLTIDEAPAFTSAASTTFTVGTAAGSPTILAPLASFNGTNGLSVIGGLAEDSSGNLFGTTSRGGA